MLESSWNPFLWQRRMVNSVRNDLAYILWEMGAVLDQASPAHDLDLDLHHHRGHS